MRLQAGTFLHYCVLYDAVYCARDAVTFGNREGFVLLVFYLKFRTPRNCNLELSASWGFHVRADAAGVLEKLQLFLGYSYITDFFPVFEFVSPEAFSFSLYQVFF